MPARRGLKGDLGGEDALLLEGGGEVDLHQGNDSRKCLTGCFHC